jgi:hypothetical protein
VAVVAVSTVAEEEEKEEKGGEISILLGFAYSV